MLINEITAKNNRQSSRLKHLSTSPSRRSRRTSSTTRRWRKPGPKPVEVFYKCHSENMIFSDVGDGSGLGWFGRVNTLDDVMLREDTLNVIASPLTSRVNTGYEKEAKVVIKVTVEGSPGPVRALVKLGANVDDTIKLVVQKYGEEGRSPRLDSNSPSSFDLHVSYFSLQSLDRSYAIGDVGSRSFYLRKNNVESGGCSTKEATTTYLPEKYSPDKQSSSLITVLPSFIARKLKKLVRRVQKLFVLLGCLHSR